MIVKIFKYDMARYDVTRKNRQFICGEEQQNTFEEIKRKLQKQTILPLPDNRCSFYLYLDSSKLISYRK